MTEVSALINLYDSDILRIDQGPLAWMLSRQGIRMNVEEFRRTVVDKFAEIGFIAVIKTYDTTENETYAFDVEIQGRIEPHDFDFDRMVHEVQNNLLDDPDQEKGPISTREAAAEFRAAHPDAHQGHGPGCVH